METLKELLKDTTEYISLVRIATNPLMIELSLEMAKELKKLGFEVALNIMYISTIDESHTIFSYLENIDEYVDYLYLVDSYGSIYPKDFEQLIRKIQNKTDITLGFHGHNNLELAFTNTLIAIECGIKLIDSTILGMGRGAGNLKTELLLTYLKTQENIEVDLNTLAELTELFAPLQTEHKWGTNLAYMVSGSYSLPQKDVMDALEIDRYSLSGIVNQLKNDDKIKLPRFKNHEKQENCLIIGGGDSIIKHIEVIKEFLNNNTEYLVIHSSSKYIELFEDIKNIQYLVVAGEELLKLNNASRIDQYILEPSPRKVSGKVLSKTNFCELQEIEFIDKYSDAPLTISLQISLDIKAKGIYLIGFDGYSELKNKKELYLMQENQEIIDSFIAKKELVSLTSTKYKSLIQKSIYGMVV